MLFPLILGHVGVSNDVARSFGQRCEVAHHGIRFMASFCSSVSIGFHFVFGLDRRGKDGALRPGGEAHPRGEPATAAPSPNGNGTSRGLVPPPVGIGIEVPLLEFVVVVVY